MGKARSRRNALQSGERAETLESFAAVNNLNPRVELAQVETDLRPLWAALDLPGEPDFGVLMRETCRLLGSDDEALVSTGITLASYVRGTYAWAARPVLGP